jgi:hypothetical protein
MARLFWVQAQVRGADAQNGVLFEQRLLANVL